MPRAYATATTKRIKPETERVVPRTRPRTARAGGERLFACDRTDRILNALKATPKRDANAAAWTRRQSSAMDCGVPGFGMTKVDPRFRRHAAKKTRVTVDERFSSMFTDPDFVAPVTVDKYGRARTDGGAKEELRRFYAQPEGSGTESDFDAEAQRLADAGVDSPFSDEDEACGSSDLDAALGAHPLVAAADVPSVDAATPRLALVNADWDAVRAVDIYTMLHAFKPAGGEVRSVAVFVSDFGRTRMAAEAAHGPSIVVEDDDKQHDDEPVGSDDDCHTPAARALKRYQLERLRYHYAVIECDSAATAAAIYSQCDGAEFETSTVFVDLRYVPDATELPPLSEAVDVCASLPRTYRPQHGAVSAALQLTRPVLAWDAPDARRAEATRRAFADADEADGLVASGSSSDEDFGSRREKYRGMLLGSAGDAFGRKHRSDDEEIDVSFDGALEEDGNREMTFEVVSERASGAKRLSSAALSRKALKAKRASKAAPDAAEAARLSLLIRPEDGADDEDVVLRSRAVPAASGEAAVRAIVEDERFRPIVEDAAFALDPTHPLYRRASAAAAIARERALRYEE